MTFSARASVTGPFALFSFLVRHAFIFAIHCSHVRYPVTDTLYTGMHHGMKHSHLGGFFLHWLHTHKRVPLRYVAIFCTTLRNDYLMANCVERFSVETAEEFMVVWAGRWERLRSVIVHWWIGFSSLFLFFLEK